MVVLTARWVALTMDLAEYLQAKVDQSSIRKVAKHIGVSKSAVEHIIKRELDGFPEIETLIAIAKAYDLTLLEVERMAGVTIPEPKTNAEVHQRLGQLVTQVPDLDRMVEDLRDMYVQDPQFVKGMVVGLEMSIAQWKARRKNGEVSDRLNDQEAAEDQRS
jgi:transcriptional regulator with XRE-family HTH domain